MPLLTVIVKTLFSYSYERYFNYYSWKCRKHVSLTVFSICYGLQVTVRKESNCFYCFVYKARKCQQYARLVWKSSSMAKVNMWKKGWKSTNLNQLNCLSLLLPTTAWETILVLLTTENNRLHQQVDELTRQSKQLLSETLSRVPRHFNGCVKNRQFTSIQWSLKLFIKTVSDMRKTV